MQLLEARTRQFTTEEYYHMYDLGWFEGQRVELIEGEIIEMPAQKNPHALAIRLVDYALRPICPPATHTIQIQSPMHLQDASEPEPDIAVLAGPPRQHDKHPTTALLVIEVSDTTLRLDRVRKGRIYARAGVAEYWILNLVDRRLEVYRQPTESEDGTWSYLSRVDLTESESVAPLAFPDARVPIAQVMP